MQIAIEAIGIVGSYRSHQATNRIQCGVKCLISSLLVIGHFAAPETLFGQTHEPVGQVVNHERLNQTTGLRGFIALKTGRNLLYQRIQRRQQPAIHLAELVAAYSRLSTSPSVNVCIHSKEGVGLIKFAEERATDFLNTFLVELKIVPRLGVGDHVPTHGVRTIFFNGGKGIHGVAQTLGHLHAVLVQHQSVGNDGLVSHRFKDHRGNGMQREEPASGLIHTFGNKVGGIAATTVEQLLIFERIVNLSIRHGTGVEPHVNQVEFTCQHGTTLSYQFNFIHIGAVKVNAVIVLLRHIPGNKTFLLKRVGGHHTGLNGSLYFIVKFFYTADADFFTSLPIAPNGQRCAPIARTREIPVVQILQPFTETTSSGSFGLPEDRLVELNHALFGCRGTDEPGIQRIVKHGLVRAPAMGIVVHMLLNFKCRPLIFHLNAKDDIQVHILLSSLFVVATALIVLGVIGIFDVSALMFGISVLVNKAVVEFRIHVLRQEILALKIHHRTGIAGLIHNEQARNAGILGHLGIVRTESRSNVHNARTVFGRHIVAGNHAECLCTLVHAFAVNQLRGFDPRHQLAVTKADQICALAFPKNLKRLALPCLEI